MIKKQRNNLLLLAVVLLFAASCKKEQGEPAEFFYAYFPDKVGTWVEYEVDYIEVDEISNVYDTSRYQLKEIIESTFIDNQGRPSLRIERYWRTSDTLPWTIKDVWYATRTTTQAEKIEEDIRFLKMVFPIRSDKRWNGNVYNTLPEQDDYKYTQLHDPLQLGSLQFDSTVTVVQRDNSNAVEISEASEVYAINVGLIRKEDVYFYITYISGNPFYTGYALHQTAIAYGH